MRRMIWLLVFAGAMVLYCLPAEAAYVGNDPINAVDPTGEEIEEVERQYDAAAGATDHAIAGTQYEGDTEARSELIGETAGELQVSENLAHQHANNGYPNGSYVGGVVETGIGAEIVEAFGGPRNEFNDVAGLPTAQHPAGPFDPAGQNRWGGGGQDTVVTTIFAQSQEFSPSGFNQFVGTATGNAQALANSTGAPIAMSVRNSYRNQPSARHFVVTPD